MRFVKISQEEFQNIDKLEAGTRRTEHRCHRLRGIMEKVYEKNLNRKVSISEVSCEGKGDKWCEFMVNN